jgi:hypothetical protein
MRLNISWALSEQMLRSIPRALQGLDEEGLWFRLARRLARASSSLIHSNHRVVSRYLN